MTRIVVDPITRIEGHLRIEAEVNDGVVTNAGSSSTMFRGIEKILKGRDPREARQKPNIKGKGTGKRRIRAMN